MSGLAMGTLTNETGSGDLHEFALKSDAYGTESPDVVLAAFRILVFVIGILGNLLVIFVILILAEYKKAVTHWYVLQLAIADSLFLLTLPVRAAENLQSGWHNLAWTCKLKETILFLNYYSSICFLVVMSLDRYIAVCHWRPTSALQKLRTPVAAIVITIGVWSACFLMCIPVMLYSTSKGTKPNCKCQYEFPRERNVTANCLAEDEKYGTPEFDDCVRNRTIEFSNGDYCIESIELSLTKDEWEDFGNIFSNSETTPSPSDDTDEVAVAPARLEPGCHYIGYATGYLGFLWFNFIVMFIVPLIVMTACYFMIVSRLNATRVVAESYGGSQSSTGGRSASVSSAGRRKRKSSSSKSNRNRIRVTIMCACMVVLFVVCWLPFHAVHLAKMNGIYRTSDFCENLSSIVSLIAFANSMLNPIIYNFVGTRFVRRIKRVRETRSFKAFFHFASGVTGPPARQSSTSGTEQNHEKQPQKQRWRSETAGKDNQTIVNKAVHCKVGNGVDESCVELMKKYPVYVGPTAPPPQQSENPSKSEPPPYQELSTTIPESQPLTTPQATVTQEQ